MTVPARFTVDRFRGVDGGPVAVELADGVVQPAGGAPGGRHLPGTLLSGVVDHHVHLGLVDGARFARSAVVEVHDLGWIPTEARRWRRDPHTGGVVRIAGPILTAPGGYPLGHSWAPDAMVRQVATPAEARAAVEDGVIHGHDLVKLALHAWQGRFDDPTLAALIAAAHEAGQRVGVHAEGPGQAERALHAGADVLVHVPWTEALPAAVITAMASRMTWISTLAIHGGAGRRVAAANAHRFLDQGGRLVYGTDLGNGPTPAGLHVGEVRALADLGIEAPALLELLVGPAVAAIPVARAILVPGPLPARAPRLARWLARARRLTDLLEA
jgi:hypothetical protein